MFEDDEEKPKEKHTYKVFCKSCHRGITWLDQRTQFGRLKGRGCTNEEIKEIMPRCQNCVTRWLKAEKAV